MSTMASVNNVEAAEKLKKKRAPNFTDAEKDLFVDVLLPKYQNFIECKKTDHQTNETKANKWQALADEFNSLSTVHFRTVENLQNLWDNLKKSARSASAHEKKETLSTGGGSRNSTRDPTARDIKVLSILGASGTGLRNNFDGDFDPSVVNLPSSTSPSEVIFIVTQENASDISGHELENIKTLDCSSIVVPTQEINNNWGSCVPSMLYQPKPAALQTKPLTSPASSKKELKKRSAEEEQEWLIACKRRRPTLVDENQQKLIAAKLELTLSTKKELDEEAKRKQALFEIEKRKKELEAEMMELQVLKMKNDLGIQ